MPHQLGFWGKSPEENNKWNNNKLKNTKFTKGFDVVKLKINNCEEESGRAYSNLCTAGDRCLRQENGSQFQEKGHLSLPFDKISLHPHPPGSPMDPCIRIYTHPIHTKSINCSGLAVVFGATHRGLSHFLYLLYFIIIKFFS